MSDTGSKVLPFEVLRQHLRAWGTAHLSCEPANRAAAEEGVRLAYAAADLAPPRSIVWCQSPLQIAKRLANASPVDNVGRNVRADVFDVVSERIGTFAEVFWKEVLIAATQRDPGTGVGTAIDDYDKCKAVNTVIGRLVSGAATGDLSRLTVQARHALLRWRGLPRLLPKWNFDEVAISPCDLVSLGVYEYLHDVLAWKEPTKPMRGLWRLARTAGWIVPHEHVCWISERPSTLFFDERARLHCPDGPALQYPDGWSVHCWKGVQVPSWMVEHPERITANTINDTFDPVLRNCMIEIMTPERFIRSGCVAKVAEDETGILWRKLWSYRGVTIGSWSAVEVANGTPESDGSHRRYFLRVPSRVRTAREAVAWTYGVSDKEYAGLQLRT